MPSPDVNLITQKIIGCAYDVSNSLGTGFVEKVYENALVHQIRKSTGFVVAQQYPIKVVYDEMVVGEFFCRSSCRRKSFGGVKGGFHVK